MSSISPQRLQAVPQPQLKPRPPYEVTLIVEGEPSRPEEVHPDLPDAGKWSLSAGDGVQEIVFEPPSGNETLDGTPLRLMFDMSAADVSARVLDACESTYILYGLDGLGRLEFAFTGRSARYLGGFPSALSMPNKVKGELVFRDSATTPKRARLLELHAEYLKTLNARKEGVTRILEQEAKRIARARLGESRTQVRNEAARYLSLKEPRDADVVLNRSDYAQVITGPDAGPLVNALARIARVRRVLEGETRTLRQAIGKWETQKREAFLRAAHWAEVQARFPGVRSAEQTALFADVPEPQSLTDARATVSRQYAALAELVTRLGAIHPLLFRLWDTDAAFEAERVLREGRESAIARSTALRNHVVDALRGAWKAAADLREKIDDDVEYVWHYPPLIHAALESMHLDAGDFAWRAAEDRLAMEQPSELLSELSMALDVIGLAALVTGAEPVAVAADIADFFVTAALTIEQVIDYWRQELAYKAILNPAHSLAVEQSAGAVAVQVFFLIVSLWGAKSSALKALH